MLQQAATLQTIQHQQLQHLQQILQQQQQVLFLQNQQMMILMQWEERLHQQQWALIRHRDGHRDDERRAWQAQQDREQELAGPLAGIPEETGRPS